VVGSYRLHLEREFRQDEIVDSKLNTVALRKGVNRKAAS
jgi:hypothetical protein